MKRLFNFQRDQDGGVIIFIALIITVLITAVGLAIDAGRIFLVNSKAQTALDAAVISAAAVSFQPTNATERAELANLIQQRGQDFFAANYPDGYMGVSVGSNAASFTTVDPDGTRIRGDLNVSVPTFFGDFAMTFHGGSGLDNVDMAEFAEVERVIPDIDLEISLALDYTKSMCDPSCASKFDVMGESVNILIDTLESSLQATSGSSTIHYAFVPFTHTVKVNNNVDNLSRSYLNYATGSDAVYNATVDSLPNVRGLSRNLVQLRNDLNQRPDETSISGTNVGRGAFWGWQALRQNSQSDFRGISQATKPGGPAPMRTAANEEDTYKIMILLTDGENESWYFNPSRTPAWYPKNDPEADSAQAAACAGAKQEGIEINVIPIGVTDANAINLLRDCATVRDGVRFYYPVSDPEELRDVFRNIANKLIDLRLRK